MQKMARRMTAAALCLFVAGSVTACKSSEEKVKESEYYQELNDKYEALQKENEELTSQIEESDEPSEDEQRAQTYLEKIGRDSIVKLEIGYYDNMAGSEFIDEKVAFNMATSIASNVDLTTKYTPEELEKNFECVYEYILYDEDNAVYEIMVYEGDYVTFSDLPNNVYYCYDASALGEAFLHYKNGYPNSNGFHRLADSALVVKSDSEYYDNRVAAKAGILINAMEKEKTTESAAVKVWKAHAKEQNKTYKRPTGVSYTFYHHGNQMKLTLYGEYFSFRNMDGKVQWYKSDKESMNELKEVFQ